MRVCPLATRTLKDPNGHRLEKYRLVTDGLRVQAKIDGANANLDLLALGVDSLTGPDLNRQEPARLEPVRLILELKFDRSSFLKNKIG